ncbi:hypothetical protein F0223_07405 [Vibrio coralliilyticus]|uniref:hypothetical protein n=1 Tax=Vibrio TaxID=662 RepID=UPI00148BC29B|nr:MULTISPECIES: hypothetical protein [Vibrio]NOI18056.1 hypothetical protein [Vibrio coralliilyticus]
MKNKNFYLLDLLRFYAAFVVFSGHYVHFSIHYGFEWSDSIRPDFFAGFGYAALAVPSFFVISGVIFAYIWR